MASLAIQDFSSWLSGAVAKATPIEPVFAAADHVAGDSFVAGPGHFLFVRNATGGALTLTLAVEGACEYEKTHGPVVVTVPAATPGRPVGPFDFRRFSEDTGRVSVTYSGAGLEVAAVKF